VLFVLFSLSAQFFRVVSWRAEARLTRFLTSSHDS
jgi:hypothetical protein